jgi:prephenate dehydrogenase
MTTLCIVGLGLMGGSLALALRAAAGNPAPPPLGSDDEDGFFAAERIIGVARSPATLSAAMASGAVDDATGDLPAAVAQADVVVLATPVRTILHQLPEIGRNARPGAMVLDMGSSKQEICRVLDALPASLQPIGGHPMCGKERAGFAAADAALYRNKVFVLCPLARTGPDALANARRLVHTIGARPLVLDAETHDRAVAAISHLPYSVAAALVNAVDGRGDGAVWALAASGFRDTTRLAASDVDMMLDVLLTNRDALLFWLDAYAGELAALRTALSDGDEAALRSRLEAARARRAGMVFSA